jgi:hypothetical protein
MNTYKQFDIIINSGIFKVTGAHIDLCDSLNTLCACITEETETDWSIGEFEECSLGSLLVGAYWAFTEWHGGQYSSEHETLCILGTVYSPGMTAGPEPDSGEQTAYDLICEYFVQKSQLLTAKKK